MIYDFSKMFDQKIVTRAVLWGNFCQYICTFYSSHPNKCVIVANGDEEAKYLAEYLHRLNWLMICGPANGVDIFILGEGKLQIIDANAKNSKGFLKFELLSHEGFFCGNSLTKCYFYASIQ